MKKIAKRLARYVIDHLDTQLTDLQKKFIKHVNAIKDEEGKFLRKERMDIVHGVAISKIIKYFVELLNKPKSINLKKANEFADAMLSTVSPDDDKGRSTLKEFFQAIQNEDNPKGLRDSANKILRILNRSTRNLSVGNSSVNRFIGMAEDPLLIKKKNSSTFCRMKPAEKISLSYKDQPGCSDYKPKTIETKEGQTAWVSSSLFSKKQDSYIIKSETKSHLDITYKTVPAKHLT